MKSSNKSIPNPNPQTQSDLRRSLNGLLLVDKPAGPTSFGIIETLQKTLRSHTGWKRSELPKMGHAGTLDPFATGLLVVGIGEGAKLCRYLLESGKSYSAKMIFGKTTRSGDLSDLEKDPVISENQNLPDSMETLQKLADQMCARPYIQTPPMHSAKKIDGVPLYELARKGIEVERKAVECSLSDFRFHSYARPYAEFSVSVSSGTFIRTLAQDFAQKLETFGALLELRRTQSCDFKVENAASLDQLRETADWTTLPSWVDFDQGLHSLQKIELDSLEAQKLIQGQQAVLQTIVERHPDVFTPQHRVALLQKAKLIGVAVKPQHEPWTIERIFSFNIR